MGRKGRRTTLSTGKPKALDTKGALRRTSDGFSLIELILVMVIAACLLGLAAPSLRAFSAGRKVHEAARMFVALCKWARRSAVSEGRTYRLIVDTQTGAFQLAAREGAAFVPLRTSWGKVFTVPVGVSVSWVEPEEAARRSYLEFDARGRGQTGHLVFTGSGGTVLHVLSRTPTERFRIVEESELELYELSSPEKLH